jgi:broad specificity phosphatase PhoE
MSAIYLLRHGQASFGADDYDQLSTLGVEQARLLGAALSGCGLKTPVLVSGGMQRHRYTLKECAAALGTVVPFAVDEDWNEFDHHVIIRAAYPEYADVAALRAAMAGHPHPRAVFQRIFATAMERWACGEHDGDYAETWAQFHQRVARALSTLIQQLPADRDALVSTSGGPIAAVVQRLLQVPTTQGIALNWTLVNAGFTRLLMAKSGARLCSLNVHTHLQGHAHLVTYR